MFAEMLSGARKDPSPMLDKGPMERRVLSDRSDIAEGTQQPRLTGTSPFA